MRYTKGKWVASYKDTFSLDMVLSPIIAAGLEKFIDTSKGDKGDWFGTPHGLGETEWEGMLEAMLFAFKAKEPDIDDYKVSFTYDNGRAKKFDVDDRVEYNRYLADCEAFYLKVERGRLLFGKHYGELWW